MTTTKNDIKTIDIQAKEWFDKVNGNSYFSARITLNFGMKDQKTVYVPFQYGYDKQYEYVAFKALQKEGLIPPQASMCVPWRYYDENGIITRQSKESNCLKRDVTAWGLTNSNQFI
jgi:hypothetical protein